VQQTAVTLKNPLLKSHGLGSAISAENTFSIVSDFGSERSSGLWIKKNNYDENGQSYGDSQLGKTFSPLWGGT
jgi:hypothetical protein